jgi:hypothetical protein
MSPLMHATQEFFPESLFYAFPYVMSLCSKPLHSIHHVEFLGLL